MRWDVSLPEAQLVEPSKSAWLQVNFEGPHSRETSETQPGAHDMHPTSALTDPQGGCLTVSEKGRGG